MLHNEMDIDAFREFVTVNEFRRGSSEDAAVWKD